jgi:aspartyl protease family protein
MRGLWVAFVVLLLNTFSAFVLATPEVIVSGLFKDKAVLTINGATKVIKVGQTTPEGVTLLASDRQSALVRIDGKEIEMTMSTRISSAFRQADKAEVRIPQGVNGHYFVVGIVKGHSIRFMVDTGASVISMSGKDAERYGIRYEDGKKIRVSTAAGIVNAYNVKLSSLTIGGIKLHGVEASILPGDFPDIPLLGNSFLSKVEISQKLGVLVLKSKL